MARLWDLRTLRRAAFSSSFKSLAMMTQKNRQTCRHLLIAVFKMGWQFLDVQPREVINGSSTVLASLSLSSYTLQDPDKLDQLQMMLDSSIEQKRNLLLPLSEITVPERSEIWRRPLETNRLKIWSGLPSRSR
ncbi:hypothetical protein Tco_1405844 [Tanacetum coccineum]